LQKSPFTPEPTLTASPKHDKQQPPLPNKSPAVEKKPEPPRKTEVVYKTSGAATNNKIV
jgi:hypothetical protein